MAIGARSGIHHLHDARACHECSYLRSTQKAPGRYFPPLFTDTKTFSRFFGGLAMVLAQVCKRCGREGGSMRPSSRSHDRKRIRERYNGLIKILSTSLPHLAGIASHGSTIWTKILVSMLTRKIVKWRPEGFS